MVILKRSLLLVSIYGILCALLLEVLIRIIFQLNLFPNRLDVIDYSKSNHSNVVNSDRETIYFEGEKLEQMLARGSKVAFNGATKEINSYSGFGPEFDMGQDALRFLTLGSSFTNGCCLPAKDSDFLFQNQLKKLLEEKLGKSVQVADSSWNGDADFKRSYIIYGNKLILPKIQHDYVLLELSFDNFFNHKNTRYRPAYFNDKKYLTPFYSYRFFVLAFNTLTYYFKFKFSESKEQVYSRELMEPRRKMIYNTDRPSFNVKEMLALSSPNERKEYYEKAKLKIQTIPETINDIVRIRDLAGRADAQLVVMIFPEFSEDELMAIVSRLEESKIPYIYINGLRRYSDRKLWTFEHPSSVLAQTIWAKEIAGELIPMVKKEKL